MAKRLGYANGSTNRKRLFVKARSHAFREFFSNTLEQNGCPKYKIDHFIGHRQSDIDSAYFGQSKDNIEKLKEIYVRYISFLSFNATHEIRSLDSRDAQELAELRKAMEKKEKESIELREKLLEAERQSLATKSELETLQKQLPEIESMKSRMDILQKYVEDLQQRVNTADKSYNFNTGEPKIIMDDPKGNQKHVIKLAEKIEGPEYAKNFIPKKDAINKNRKK